jgi:hypothetical protein
MLQEIRYYTGWRLQAVKGAVLGLLFLKEIKVMGA